MTYRPDDPAVMTPTQRRQEIAALGRMTVAELREKHVDVFGERAKSGNKDWLRKRIAWRMQANAHGDLSERAKRRACRRAEELANDAGLRTTAPKLKQPDGQIATTTAVAFDHDARLPMPGAILRRRAMGEANCVDSSRPRCSFRACVLYWFNPKNSAAPLSASLAISSAFIVRP